MSVDPRGDLLDENESQDPSIHKDAKRQSLFQKLFGRKIPKSSYHLLLSLNEEY